MEPTIVEKGQITLVGFSFYGDPFSESDGWTEGNEIGGLWNRFSAYLTDQGERILHRVDEDRAYEVHVVSDDTAEKGHREVFVGVEVERLEDVPAELLVKLLPATQYAIFTLQGEQIASDWCRVIYQESLPHTGYEEAHRYSIQLYDERFKGVDNLADSVLEVYVPVKPSS